LTAVFAEFFKCADAFLSIRKLLSKLKLGFLAAEIPLAAPYLLHLAPISASQSLLEPTVIRETSNVLAGSPGPLWLRQGSRDHALEMTGSNAG
jgi:hypothetical protein